MYVDDGALALLVSSFLVLVAAVFQLIGCWARWWTPIMIGVFLAAIVVQWWNYSAGGAFGSSVAVSDQAWTVITVVLMGGVLGKLIGTFTAAIIGAVDLAAVVVALAWGFGQFHTWTEDTMGWDVSLFIYVILLIVMGFGLYLLTGRLFSWRWLHRTFNFLLVTFICTQAARVIDERDPWSGFGTTEIQVFDIDTAWIVEWMLMTVAWIILYYLSYKYLPWHSDRHQDAKDKLYSDHLKHEKEHRKHKHKHHEPSTQSLLYPDLG